MENPTVNPMETLWKRYGKPYGNAMDKLWKTLWKTLWKSYKKVLEKRWKSYGKPFGIYSLFWSSHRPKFKRFSMARSDAIGPLNLMI